MKITLSEVDSRIVVRRVEMDNIQLYDIDNAYPQRIDHHINGSPRAKQCTSTLARFIRGRGVKDGTFYKAVINNKGLTVDKLNRKISDDISKFNGCAIHVSYNGLGKKVSATPISFKELRLPIPGDDGIITHVLHHPDWGREISKNFRKEKIVKYPIFNDNPDVVLQQMIEAGGIDKYTGQVYWYSVEENKYPLSTIDSVLEDVVSDNEAKQYRLNNITTSFLSHTAIITDELADNRERQEFNERIQQYQGARRGSRMLHIEKKSADQTFEIKHFDQPSNAPDKEFEYTESAVNETIRKPFMVPPVLLGDLVSGKLGTATEIQDAYSSYNALTYDFRLIIEEIYKKIFSGWPANICPSGDYSIIPIGFDTGDENQPLFISLGQSATSSLQSIISDTTILPAQKKNILTIIFGLTQDQANAIVEGTPINVSN